MIQSQISKYYPYIQYQFNLQDFNLKFVDLNIVMLLIATRMNFLSLFKNYFCKYFIKNFGFSYFDNNHFDNCLLIFYFLFKAISFDENYLIDNHFNNYLGLHFNNYLNQNLKMFFIYEELFQILDIEQMPYYH